MRYQINVSSNQLVQRLTKIRNTPTSTIHILMQIMIEIFLTGNLSPQNITSSMVTSFTDTPRNNLRHLEKVPMHKQEQCTQACYIKIGSGFVISIG